MKEIPPRSIRYAGLRFEYKDGLVLYRVACPLIRYTTPAKLLDSKGIVITASSACRASRLRQQHSYSAHMSLPQKRISALGKMISANIFRLFLIIVVLSCCSITLLRFPLFSFFISGILYSCIFLALFLSPPSGLLSDRSFLFLRPC